jgi:hypothetical protein
MDDDPYLLSPNIAKFSKIDKVEKLSSFNYDFCKHRRVIRNNSTYVVLLDNSGHSRISQEFNICYNAIFHNFNK